MAISTLPLCYCTNVHPGRTVAEVLDGLQRYTLRVRDRWERPLAAGLWLARPVAAELLASSDALDRFAGWLADQNLPCHTLNAFPFGDFHGERVKENVYLPDWTATERAEYTLDCAAILARLIEASPSVGAAPGSLVGSISTLPLGFKRHSHSPDFLDRCIDRLLDVAAGLARLRSETGRAIRLAIEPEPLCVLETTAETIAFFERLWARAGEGALLDAVREHIGVCFDVCHQAVEFEDCADAIGRLDAAGVRINKVHITCALRLEDPGRNEAARSALAAFAEPRYLHQLTALTDARAIHREVDLTPKLARNPPPELHSAREWRVHFHVPVDAETLPADGLPAGTSWDESAGGPGTLRTTRDDLRSALSAVARLDYAPHLEVETYTWSVLPGESPPDLVEGLVRELRATADLLERV